jgi:hypothetical protein
MKRDIVTTPDQERREMLNDTCKMSTRCLMSRSLFCSVTVLLYDLDFTMSRSLLYGCHERALRSSQIVRFVACGARQLLEGSY